jgi:hypothetical protein
MQRSRQQQVNDKKSIGGQSLGSLFTLHGDRATRPANAESRGADIGQWYSIRRTVVTRGHEKESPDKDELPRAVMINGSSIHYGTYTAGCGMSRKEV